jgi:hypothetical protein
MAHDEAVTLLNTAVGARLATDDELDDLATLDVMAWNLLVDERARQEDDDG